MTQTTLTRPSRRRRERSRPRQSLTSRARAGLAAAMGLALLAYLVVVAVGHGYPATHPQMGTGSIWLPSANGQLTLFDGSTVTPTDQVQQLAQPGDGLMVAEAGDTAYAVNQRTGVVSRISGTTLPPFSLAKNLIRTAKGGTADKLEVFATQTAFYAVSALAVAASPAKLTTIGTFPAGTATTSADAVTDQDGRLWVLDPHSGSLTWFADGQRHGRADAVPPGTAAVLAATDGQPVIITPARGTAQLLNPATGTVQRTLTVPGLGLGDTVTAAGSAVTPQVVIANGTRGTAVICSFTAPCHSPLSLRYQGQATLGQPVEAAGDVFIPNCAANDVVVISLATSGVRVAKNILRQPANFDLLTKDGIAFYNDPAGPAAGVISSNATVSHGSKYSPSTPAAKAAPLPVPSGSATTSPSPPAATATKPTTDPKAPALVNPLSTPTAASSSPVGFSASPGAGPQSAPASPARGPLVITNLIVNPSQPMVGQQATISVLYTGTAPASWTWMIDGRNLDQTRDPDTRTTFTAAGTYTVAVSAGAARTSLKVNVSASAAPDAQCGETITANLTLNTDLNCSGNGLIVDANNVTVDLNGHTISGSGGSGTGIHLETTAGSGAQAVNFTVKGGTLTGFGQAVNDDGIGAAAATVSEMVINGGSVCGDSAEQCDIESSRITGAPVGCGRNGKLTINNSIFSDSPVSNGDSCLLVAAGTTFGDAQVAVDESFDSQIENCSFSDDGIGLETELGINRNVILLVSGNKFEHDREAGIYVTVLRIGALGVSWIINNTFSADGSVPGADGQGNPLQGGLHVEGLGPALPNAFGKFTVAGNRGSDDGGLDIWAAPDVVGDGGGNISDHGTAGCVNVHCATP